MSRQGGLNQFPYKAPIPGLYKKVLTLKTVPTHEEQHGQQRCADEQGFSLHAEVRCAMNQRNKLEQLCRYITRPAIANERLELNSAGDVVLQLKSPYKDGTTHVVMSPLDFMQRLAALVPRPRLNLIRFHGVLAPNAKLRSEIIPDKPATVNETSDDLDTTQHQATSARISWARLLTKPPGAVLNGERRPEGRKPGRVFVDGCSISTWNIAPTVVAP